MYGKNIMKKYRKKRKKTGDHKGRSWRSSKTDLEPKRDRRRTNGVRNDWTRKKGKKWLSHQM